MLVDDRPARAPGRSAGEAACERPAADLDRPRVGDGRAGCDRHQRGLPRAVLAHERVHLAREHLERHALERDDARERLDDVAQAQNDAGSVHRRLLLSCVPYFVICAGVSLLEG